ncbi:hypothetical protein TrVE_jg4615 [Triparma verrucosa]|uniref:Thioredoxin domain-containing protein n=1 Tax=Triparma verrucosa TaxID=1606542 RepID=A0A9W7C2F9_9STRA|nr:hypothetical protein TrVE_jg4615 [Triparma verrucosa]
MPASSNLVLFLKKSWSLPAFLQAFSLALLGFFLTLSVSGYNNWRELEFKDYAMPAAVGVYVYWRNGILHQADGGIDANEATDGNEGVLDRRAPRLGRTIDWFHGSPPPSHSSHSSVTVFNILYVFSPTCIHSQKNLSGFTSAAANFVGKGDDREVFFGAISKEGEDTISDLMPLKKNKNLSKISLGTDTSDVIETLFKNLSVDSFPHVFVIKNGSVEWDGHPCNLEGTLALMVGFWED